MYCTSLDQAPLGHKKTSEPDSISFVEVFGTPVKRARALFTAMFFEPQTAVSFQQPPLLIKHISMRTTKEEYKNSSIMTQEQQQTNEIPHEEVVVIGSGPGAHTAAIYLARAESRPLLFEGKLAGGVAAGGQLTTTTDVENFPGFPNGIGGYEFTRNLRQQSTKFGTRILSETVAKVNLSQQPYTVCGENGTVVTADTIVIATGATTRRLSAGNAYWQKGVSACAVCDGAAPIFRKKPVVVVGGGDSAMEEAMFLSRYASHVTIVHRRDQLRASKIMQTRARKTPKIEFLLSHEISKAKGDDLLQSLVVRHVESGETKRNSCSRNVFCHWP